MSLHLRRILLIGMLTFLSAAWTAVSRAAEVDPAGSCNCPDGYVPIDGGCCPECYFLDPPCLLPCLICQQMCGKTGDICDYSVGLTCCGGAQLCCPAGAQSTCSDVACAE